MIDYNEVEKELIKIESSRDTSYAAMERLAPLYCALIYKRLYNNPEMHEPQPLAVAGDSAFLQAVSGKDSVRAWAVMDELMDTLQVVNARVYDNVMRKIEAI